MSVNNICYKIIVNIVSFILAWLIFVFWKINDFLKFLENKSEKFNRWFEKKSIKLAKNFGEWLRNDN